MLQNINALLRGYVRFAVIVTYSNGLRSYHRFRRYEDANRCLKEVPQAYSVTMMGDHLLKGWIVFYIRSTPTYPSWQADARL